VVPSWAGRADRDAPTIGRVFLEYAQYRGFVVDPRCPAPRPPRNRKWSEGSIAPASASPPQQENVIFCGPVGVGKAFLACALGHSACRAGHRVRYVAVTKLLPALHQSRADNSFEWELRSWLAPDLLFLETPGRSGEPANRPLHGDSPRSKKGLAQATLMP
jgi:IstB-like ATP binding protein